MAADSDRLFLRAPKIHLVSGNVGLTMNENGHIGVQTLLPHEALTINGILSLEEQDNYDRTHDGYGSVWAKSDGKLYYTNDIGTEYDLTSGGGGGVTSAQGAEQAVQRNRQSDGQASRRHHGRDRDHQGSRPSTGPAVQPGAAPFD